MKVSFKKFVSMALAVVTTFALTATAFAADYYAEPVFPTSTPSTSVTTSEMSSAISSSSDVATVEVKSERSIYVGASVMKKLAKSGKSLVIKSDDATITIDGSSITNVKKINLSMKIVNTANKTTIRMKSKSDLGCEAKIVVTTCKMSAEKLAKAHVYCDGEDLGPVELNEDGYPVITVTKGGTYTIK